ncbi:MAG TPA: sulfite exporter TauE/SafE family protein [Acidimicrobiales bacterium]|nr:sulfite exporter TauE/SafE family protein [Acidimicrobiales bacterium]
MRALLTSPLGLLIGLSLGALGGGGSVLAVPALVYAAGEGAKGATTTSLLVVGLSALFGAAAHWRRGRARLAPGILFGAAGAGGSLVGSHLNAAVDPQVLLLAFSALMVVAAWRMWAGRRARGPRRPAGAIAGGRGATTVPAEGRGTTTTSAHRIGARLALAVLGAGTVVGFLTGFFGVGGGFVIVPALVLVLGYDMPVAVGTSLVVIAINSAVALVARVGTSGIDWHIALPFTVLALAGSFFGERLAGRARTEALTRWFVVLLVVVAGYTALRAGLAL